MWVLVMSTVKNKGNTLMEILISLAILMVIGSIITTLVAFLIKDMKNTKIMDHRLQIVDSFSKELTKNTTSKDMNNLKNNVIKINSKKMYLQEMQQGNIADYLVNNNQGDGMEYDIMLEFFQRDINEINITLFNDHKEILKIQLYKEL